MTRIKRQEIYPVKLNPVSSDYVVGSDSENNGKTVSFLLETIAGENASLQDNKFQIIDLGFFRGTDTTVIANRINNLPDNLTDYKTVGDTKIVLFSATVSILATASQAPQLTLFGLIGKGKGVYGVNGNVTVDPEDLFIFSDRRRATYPNPTLDNPNAVVQNLGVLADSNVNTMLGVINNHLPVYNITSGTNWFFEFTVDGNRYLYGFDGANGTYGDGQTPMLESDVFLIYDEANPPYNKPASGLEAIDEGNGIGWRYIGRNPTYYGNIGFGATDLSDSISPSVSRGATGTYSLAVGQDVTASGYSSTALGYEALASGTFAFASGYNVTASGYLSTAFGLDSSVSGFYSTSFGVGNVTSGKYALTAGVGLVNKSVGVAVFGQANLDYTATTLNSPTAPLLIVGNGQLAAGEPNTVLTRSDAFKVLMNGSILAPSQSIAVVDSDLTGRILVTKEWVLANGGSGDNIYTADGSIPLGIEREVTINSGAILSFTTSTGSQMSLEDDTFSLEYGEFAIGDSFGNGIVSSGFDTTVNASNGLVFKVGVDDTLTTPIAGQVLAAVDGTGKVAWTTISGIPQGLQSVLNVSDTAQSPDTFSQIEINFANGNSFFNFFSSDNGNNAGELYVDSSSVYLYNDDLAGTRQSQIGIESGIIRLQQDSYVFGGTTALLITPPTDTSLETEIYVPRPLTGAIHYLPLTVTVYGEEHAADINGKIDLGETLIKTSRITLNTAQLDSLGSGSTINLLPAVPSKVYEIISASLKYISNGTDHDNNGETVLYGGAYTCKQVGQAGRSMFGLDATFASYMDENTPVTIQAVGINAAGANGTAVVDISYRLIEP